MKNIIPANVINKLQDMKETAEINQARWMESFGKNPIYALENVDSQFDYAARLEIAIRTLALIAYGEEKGVSDEMIMAEVRRHVYKELFRLGRMNTNFSTSQATNLMDGARVAVLSELSEWLMDF